MGQLIYDGTKYTFEDRLLAHVKFAVGSRLRKQESFFLSWSCSPEEGSGRNSIWLSPACPLTFRFSGSRAPLINKTWLSVLSGTSHGGRGMIITGEQEAESYAAKHPAPF